MIQFLIPLVDQAKDISPKELVNLIHLFPDNPNFQALESLQRHKVLLTANDEQNGPAEILLVDVRRIPQPVQPKFEGYLHSAR